MRDAVEFVIRGSLGFVALLMLDACSARSTPPSDSGTTTDASMLADGSAGGLPAGWLFTSGNQIEVSDGKGGGTTWVGRGVNMDDIFFCGENNTLMDTAAEADAEGLVSGLLSGWKPTFVRVSLGMDSYTAVSWLSNAAQYKTPMTNIINSIGMHANVYVLVTLRSDASMTGQDETDGDAEATGLPTASTDATYVALVDTFAQSSFVLFGVANEPGGDKLGNAAIASAMTHAVATIRAEEDKLGVPHHLVSVQGNGWTSDISAYGAAPLAGDNIIYEVHGYPPMASQYTYANLPVILGEYGDLDSGSAPAFYADVESKHIPTLAWDFDSFNDCSPDLLTVNSSAANLVPSTWGSIVQAYLLAHAQ